MRIPVRVWDEGKAQMVFVGYILGDTFHRSVKNDHFLNLYQGYALQVTALDMLRRRHVVSVYLQREDGVVLISSLEDWLSRKAMSLTFTHGKQVCLPVKYMSELKHKEE